MSDTLPPRYETLPRYHAARCANCGEMVASSNHGWWTHYAAEHKEAFEGKPSLAPRYETLELVYPEGTYTVLHPVPEPPRPSRRRVVEVVGIVLQTVAWFLIGVLIGYTMAS